MIQALKYHREDIEKIFTSSDVVTQMVVAIEEMAELQKELTKYIRFFKSGDKEYYIGGLVEEMADVLIMLEQIKVFFDLPEALIGEKVKKKIERRLREIENVV